MRYLWTLLIVGASFFYFNWQFLYCADQFIGNRSFHIKDSIITFFINYSLFIICSLLSMHLVINWTVYFFVFILEIWLIYRKELSRCIYLGALGVVIGLSANSFFRCLIALLWNKPLMSFDSHLDVSNMKEYPIFLGFLLTGLFFHFARRSKLMEKIKKIFEDSGNLFFMIALMLSLYAYLALNLFLYYTTGSLFLKMWGIKSCAFVLISFYLGVVYASRVSQLNAYRKQNEQAQQRLLLQKMEEEQIQYAAYTDPLTGFYNRRYFDERLSAFLKEKTQPVCVCFIDVNQLKVVNDKQGHSMGDRYLLAVAKTLRSAARKEEDLIIRYGGDEFVIVFVGIEISLAQKRMDAANASLVKKSNSEEYPFAMSISYGVAEGRRPENFGSLIKKADALMYENKKYRRSQN